MIHCLHYAILLFWDHTKTFYLAPEELTLCIECICLADSNWITVCVLLKDEIVNYCACYNLNHHFRLLLDWTPVGSSLGLQVIEA